MTYSNRVSKIAVQDSLRKYLSDDLAAVILKDIIETDECDRENVVGMTFAEWNERFDDNFSLVWADDTRAGFGNAGQPVYGDPYDCVICKVSYTTGHCTLHVWCEGITSNKPWINAAMAEHAKRQRKEV